MKRIAFLAIILLSFLSVKAQEGEIIFTDFEPDLCISVQTAPIMPHDTIYVDFTNDGVADFKVFFIMVSTGTIYPYNIVVDGYDRTQRGEYDTIVPSETYPWFTGGYYCWSIENPTFFDEIVGVKKIVDGNNYYAWVRLYSERIPHGGGVVFDKMWTYVDKFAYCTIPDYPLRWGQTSLDDDIAEHYAANIMVYPNPTTGIINVSGENITAIEVVNIMGQTMLKKNCDGDEANVDISSFTPGIYFVKVGMNDGNEFSEKIIKE